LRRYGTFEGKGTYAPKRMYSDGVCIIPDPRKVGLFITREKGEASQGV